MFQKNLIRVNKALTTLNFYLSQSQSQATNDGGQIDGLDVLFTITQLTTTSRAYGL